ncbi:MAG: Na+ dependent nucleoside transporter N-terminal domain-containing protein [Limisphaerales bacterium]
MELRTISLPGWITMILAAWAISYNRKLFRWRTVVWGAGLQLAMAVLILKAPWGKAFFEFAGKTVKKLLARAICVADGRAVA